jgi:serine phosphatase RsbU (regulator of sigma subunit)
VQQLTLQRGDVVLLHTDGVSERFELEDYPEILGHAPATIVRVVLRRFGKDRDDAGCLALRCVA